MDYKIKTTIKWDDNNTYFTTINNLLSKFTVDLCVWDNTLHIGATTIRGGIHEPNDAVIRLFFMTTRSSKSYLIQIDIIFQLPIDGYHSPAQVPNSWWITERNLLLTELQTTRSYTVVEGTIN